MLQTLRRAAVVVGLALPAFLTTGLLEVDAQSSAERTGPPSLDAGPVRLLSAAEINAKRLEEQLARPIDPEQGSQQVLDTAEERSPRKRKAGEFERYVQRVTGDHRLTRFEWKQSLPATPQPLTGQRAAPDDYLIAPGDQVRVAYWGSLDADLTLTVDRQGRVTIPRVGTVPVAGRRLQEVQSQIERQTARVFKNFDVQVSLGTLRPVRVVVTGFVERPGAYVVSALSAVSSVLMQQAGGPSEAGSYRMVELRRSSKTLSRIDLYELMVEGRQDADLLLQDGDVVHVHAVGRQVAVSGSVNRPGIYELKDKENSADLLRLAAGFAPIADRGRVALQSLQASSTGLNLREFTSADLTQVVPEAGDILHVSSAGGEYLPKKLRAVRVRLEGEVASPGTYVLNAGTTLEQAVQRAGGITAGAYLFGMELNRDSVRDAQQLQVDKAIRDIVLELGRQTQSSANRTPEEQQEVLRQRRHAETLIARLREARPQGRVVLPIEPGDNRLPSIELVDGDVVRIPSTPSDVGVYGSVFQSGGFAYQPDRELDHYLTLAGNSRRTADTRSIYLLRANGSVRSARQGGFFSKGDAMQRTKLQPGDTIFVPEDPQSTSVVQSVKDWTQVLYQLGVGLAAVISVSK